MRRSFRRRRSGYTLVFFAMMLFGIMAMAALVIDIGFARLTQRQMQTAVDSAALEGLRFRDEYPPEYAPPMSLEESRRRQASNIVAWTFDDDFETSNVDPFNFGAGPRVDLGAGIDDGGTINAGQFINSPENPNPNPRIGSLPNPPVYKPTQSDGTTRGLELNVSDAIHGDMLGGAYIAENPSDPNDPDWHDENDDYIRSDFPTSSPDDTAFLVRMRRSNDFDGLDRQQYTSSHGPTIPFLFGRGSLLPAADPSAGYSPRHHGMTIRATAIATTIAHINGTPERIGNVKLAGPSFPNGLFGVDFDGVSGVTPFAIEASSWPPTIPFVIDSDGSTTTGDAFLMRITDLQGPLSETATTASVSSNSGFPTAPFTARIDLELITVTAVSGTNWTISRGSNGTTPSSHNSDTPVVSHRTLSIGTPLTEIQSGQLISNLDLLQSVAIGHRYVPIYSTAQNRVVGFGFADSWSWDKATNELTISALVGGLIVSMNASAGLSQVADISSALNVLSDNLALSDSLLAPVVAR